MSHRELATHEVELQGADARHSFQYLAQQRFLGRAVHLLDQVSGLALSTGAGFAFDRRIHADLTKRFDHGRRVVQAMLNSQAPVHEVEMELVDAVHAAKPLADQRFFRRAIHVGDDELRGLAARRR